MQLLVGLGNPGTEYQQTRHNFGFMVTDHLRQIWKFPVFKEEKKFQAAITSGTFGEKKILLAKPLTYMNLSGPAIQMLVHYYKIPLAELLIIHDDLDLPFGKLRLKAESSAGGHNGVKSIIQALGTQDFLRLKLGIGNEHLAKIPAEKFVLQNFDKKEAEQLPEIIIEAGDSVEYLMQNGLSAAMNQYN